MPLEAGPGSEGKCEQQNPVVWFWQDVTFLWGCLRQQVLAGYTPCPTLPWRGWRRCSSPSPWPSFCLCSLFPPPCCLPSCLLCPPPLGSSSSPHSGLSAFVSDLPARFCPFHVLLFLLLSISPDPSASWSQIFCFFLCLLCAVYSPPSPIFCLKGFICLTIPLTVLALSLCPRVPRSLCVGGDGVVSREESIGFSTPAVGQLPWQQGQRVPTATADAVAEGEGWDLQSWPAPQCAVSPPHLLDAVPWSPRCSDWPWWDQPSTFGHSVTLCDPAPAFSLFFFPLLLKSEDLLCPCCGSLPYQTPTQPDLPVMCPLSW